MKKVLGLAFLMLMVMIGNAGATVGIGLQFGLASYGDGLLPGSNNLENVPVGYMTFQMPVTEALELDLKLNYSTTSFDYTRPDLRSPQATGEETIDFRDVGVALSAHYNFYKPEYKTTSAYFGGGLAVHFLNTDSDQPAATVEYLEDKSTTGAFGVVGLRFKLDFLPTFIQIEGMYHTFSLHDQTVSNGSINAGFMWYFGKQ